MALFLIIVKCYLMYAGTCTSPQQACDFTDPAIWVGLVAPGSEDEVVLRGGAGNKKQIEIYINTSVSVKSITVSNNVLLNIRQNGVLNATGMFATNN